MATILLFIMSGTIILIGSFVLALTFWHWKQQKELKLKEGLESKPSDS